MVKNGMSDIQIQKISITRLHTDAIVNAANEGLWEGGGVCGVIFREAGSKELRKACEAIGGCKTGSAVMTPGFALPAKYIIHAVGPRWTGGERNEAKLLYGAYERSLLLAKEKDCHSIGFPLISAGIFGYPVELAWRKALQACADFIEKNPDYEIEVVFAILDDDIQAIGEKNLREIFPAAARHKMSDECMVNQAVREKAYLWCHKYEILFQTIFETDELRKHLQSFNVYQLPQNYMGIYPILHGCFEQAYQDGIVISNYGKIIEKSGISEKDLAHPSKEWIESLSKDQILACIAWHFRRDHFVEGSWRNDSVANGHMLDLARGYLGKQDKSDIDS